MKEANSRQAMALLYALGQVEDRYLEEARPPDRPKQQNKRGRQIALVLALAAVLGALHAVATNRGFDWVQCITGALPESDPTFIQHQLEQGQWVYMNDDNIVVIVPESPVKLLLSQDGGQSWRETVIEQSQSMEFLGEWQQQMQYHGGFVGFNGENGYLVLTSGISMNHQALRIFLTQDGGQTWRETGTPYDQHISVLTGVGFADGQTGFICYRYYEDAGPDIWRTTDGGLTWRQYLPPLPPDYPKETCRFTPQSPVFEGCQGKLPILVRKGEQESLLILHSQDGGLSWYY